MVIMLSADSWHDLCSWLRVLTKRTVSVTKGASGGFGLRLGDNAVVLLGAVSLSSGGGGHARNVYTARMCMYNVDRYAV